MAIVDDLRTLRNCDLARLTAVLNYNTDTIADNNPWLSTIRDTIIEVLYRIVGEANNLTKYSPSDGREHMPDLDDYFKFDKSGRESHPLIRLLDVQQHKPEFGKAKVQILRERAALGFYPAQLSLQFFDKQDRRYEHKTEDWDAELNEALVDHKIVATDESNEIQRFGLALDASLQYAENRYGDGFFNAVLMLVVDRSPFAKMEPIQGLRPCIVTNNPLNRGHSTEVCSTMIQAALQDRWIQLRRNLAYDKTDAERILAGTLAYYLDDRFSITDGQKLGWLRTN